MTTHFQPGHHPDADQLNAFAEHALPQHEQQATLAHLATCADCRAIVYLAQPPSLEPAAHPHPVRTRTPLFSLRALSFPMLAFPAAAALACLILLTIHFRNTASNQIAVPNTAHIETPPPPPAAPPESATTPAPVRTPPAATVPAPRTALPAAGAAGPQATPPPDSFGLASTLKPEIATATTLLAQKKVALGGMSGASYAPLAPPLTAPPPAAASPAIPISPIAPQQQALAASAAAPPRELRSAATQYDRSGAQAQQTAPAASAANNGNTGIYGGTGQINLNENYIAGVPAANMARQASSNPVAGAASVDTVDQFSMRTGSVSATSLQAKQLPTLPSKLPALSVATSSQHQLAIDTAGALFRSGDAGVTWQPIPVQWTGRAISVVLLPSPNLHVLAKSLGGLTAPPAPAKSSATPSTPATFQLTTDAGDLWLSPDGQTWKHK